MIESKKETQINLDSEANFSKTNNNIKKITYLPETNNLSIKNDKMARIIIDIIKGDDQEFEYNIKIYRKKLIQNKDLSIHCNFGDLNSKDFGKNKPNIQPNILITENKNGDQRNVVNVVLGSNNELSECLNHSETKKNKNNKVNNLHPEKCLKHHFGVKNSESYLNFEDKDDYELENDQKGTLIQSIVYFSNLKFKNNL